MKLGVSSYSLRKHAVSTGASYTELCDVAKEMGFDCIEFVNLDFPGFTLMGTMEQTARAIKEHCDKIGLEIVAYTVGANLMAQDIDEELAKLKSSVDIAEILGAPVMRHDVCGALPAEHLYNWQDAIEVMVPRIREITEYAQAKGIRTCTENHGFIFQPPERVEALIRAVGHKNYGWLIDVGNFLCADVDPAHAVMIAAPYAFHVHVKDFIVKKGDTIKPTGFFQTAAGSFIRGTIVGHGDVPVVNCINILKARGYSGVVSIEFEGMEECLPAIKAGYEFLKAIV